MLKLQSKGRVSFLTRQVVWRTGEDLCHTLVPLLRCSVMHTRIALLTPPADAQPWNAQPLPESTSTEEMLPDPRSQAAPIFLSYRPPFYRPGPSLSLQVLLHPFPKLPTPKNQTCVQILAFPVHEFCCRRQNCALRSWCQPRAPQQHSGGPGLATQHSRSELSGSSPAAGPAPARLQITSSRPCLSFSSLPSL